VHRHAQRVEDAHRDEIMADMAMEELPPDYERGGRLDALALLGTVVSGDDGTTELTTAAMQGFDSYRALAAALVLLIEALEEHGTDPAAWAALKQDELAAQEED
jgi:hypothetical protein